MDHASVRVLRGVWSFTDCEGGAQVQARCDWQHIAHQLRRHVSLLNQNKCLSSHCSTWPLVAMPLSNHSNNVAVWYSATSQPETCLA